MKEKTNNFYSFSINSPSNIISTTLQSTSSLFWFNNFDCRKKEKKKVNRSVYKNKNNNNNQIRGRRSQNVSLKVYHVNECYVAQC